MWYYIIDAVHDRKVQWTTNEYTMFFSHSDWLYFLWHGTNSYLELVYITTCVYQ